MQNHRHAVATFKNQPLILLSMVEIEKIGLTSIRIGIGNSESLDLEAILAQEPARKKPKKDELPAVLNMVGHYVREYFVQNDAPPDNRYLFRVAAGYTPDKSQQKALAEYGSMVGACLRGVEERMNTSARMHLRSFLKPGLAWQAAYGALAGAFLGYAIDNVPAGVALGVGYTILHRAGMMHGSHAGLRKGMTDEIRMQTAGLYESTLKKLECI